MFLYHTIIPAGMNSYCFPPFLSAGIFGGSAESDKKMILCVLCGSAVKIKYYT